MYLAGAKDLKLMKESPKNIRTNSQELYLLYWIIKFKRFEWFKCVLKFLVLMIIHVCFKLGDECDLRYCFIYSE